MVELIDKVCNLAREAGERIMPFYRAALTVKSKEDRSPLTEADLASHRFLVGALPDLLPGVPVISEESENAASAALPARFWLVDPLDGTKEFLKGTNEFTVNIALVKDGHPILGVVYAPALDLTYYGTLVTGAWRRVGAQAASRFTARRANPAGLAIVASKDHAGPLVADLLKKYPAASLRSMGSSLKFCLVAEGSADIYLRDVPTMEWDTAAAHCVVEAAGGIICLLDGSPLVYGKPGLKNPSIITLGDPSLARVVTSPSPPAT
ncbi:MAG TPA: 3'(2'),5'-bisphosphate nucleotidase CysQ [Verrucomicrobiae bacterium]|jgi:3'(2'), 5'-bisphosphate nucleotidase|nr:3'(2'),5'-bisphosphate nucleotidase CysQ [Verrucomicrobiae bacterium]